MTKKDENQKQKGSPFEKKLQAVCKKCSAASVKVYVRNALRLYRLVTPDAAELPETGAWLTKPALYKEFDALDLNKRRLLSTAAIKSLDAYGKDRVKAWGDRLTTASDEYDKIREKRGKTEKEILKWPAKGGYDALKRAARMQKQQSRHVFTKQTKTVKDLWEIQKWLILQLYSNHALRLDFADVFLEKPGGGEGTKNYLHKYRRKGWILTLNVYKTAKFRGAQEIKMNRSASIALSKVVPWIKELTTHGKLLTNRLGGPLSRNGLSKLLTRITEKLLGRKGFSASLIRVLKATKFAKELEISKKLSEEMLHTQKQNFEYSRK